MNQAVIRGIERQQAQPGSVTFIQCFGSAVNLNLHFHMIFLEGVYLDRTAQGRKPRFLKGKPPTDADIAAVVQTISRRVIRKLRHLGYLEASVEDPVSTGYDPLVDQEPELARTLVASVQQRIAFGERAGQQVRRIGSGFGYEGEHPALTGARCASVHGLSLHANTQVPAHRRDQLERLLRYMARGAVALECLHEDARGDLVYTFTKPWSDGTTGITLSPVELLEKLAALVPLPRVHLVRYGGCLAPHSLLRGAIISTLRQQGVDRRNTTTFVLEWVQPGEASPILMPDYVSHAFKNTVNFWRGWIGHSTYQGRWREMVDRAALTLKLLVSQPYGSLVAAPTFGLPEKIGGKRNWDYRYTWIRDASFTLYALISLGYTGEAAAFMQWIETRCRECAPDGSLQVLYGIDGRHILTEEVLTHLEGYRQSAPVRIGNHAYSQLQLDIYGELMDTVYLSNKYGAPIPYDLWTDLTRMLNWLCEHWYLKDEGIWETRGGPHEFLHSRVMCWVALDRGMRLALQRSFPAPLARWRRVRDRIYHDIFTHFWDAQRQTFVQYKGAQSLDAATLLMPLMRFMSPIDPRWLSTLRAIEEVLVNDSLVYRYKTGDAFWDGLLGQEGTFSMCSFWYVECLSRAGDLQQARFFFEKALGYANHLGLYAEELGPRGEHLRNFPQAFTHLALISAAYDLDRRLSAAGQQG